MEILKYRLIAQSRGKEPHQVDNYADVKSWLPYDKDLQMFIEPSPEINFGKLRFLRWLAERDRLEHEAYGPSSGPLVDVRGMPVGVNQRLAQTG